MSATSISSPILRSFIHGDVTIGTSPSSVLATNTTSSRRIVVLVQNKSATATIQVILADTGSVGIIVPPLSNISLDNYNGPVRAFSDTAGTVVHVAYSQV